METCSKGFRWTLTAYGCVSVLMLVPSALLWLQDPLRLTAHEFDFFLGQLGASYGDPLSPMALLPGGKLPHVVLFLVLGGLFYRLVTRHGEAIEALSRGKLTVIVVGFSLLYTLGLPWVSPDIFYYMGHGWLQAAYKMDAYRQSISMLPNYQADEMFSNVHPWLATLPGTYGPLYEKYSALLAAGSGGNIQAALVLFKLGNLGFYLGSAGLLSRLAAKIAGPAGKAVFIFACNPLSLFCLLTCVHNDVQLDFFLLCCLFLAQRNLALGAGGALGAAVAIKIVGVVFLPALLIYWVRRSTGNLRWHQAVSCLVGFTIVFLATAALYPGSLERTAFLVGSNWQVLRDSFPLVIEPLLALLPLGPLSAWRTILSLCFVALGAWITLRPLADGRKPDVTTLAAQMFMILACYFVVAAPAVMEWYLTWLVAPALLSRRREMRAAVIILTSFFMPFVIFTIRSGRWFEYAANTLLYVTLVVSLGIAWRYFRESEAMQTLDCRVGASPAT